MRFFRLVINYFRFAKVGTFKYFLGFRICEIYKKLNKNRLKFFIPIN